MLLRKNISSIRLRLSLKKTFFVFYFAINFLVYYGNGERRLEEFRSPERRSYTAAGRMFAGLQVFFFYIYTCLVPYLVHWLISLFDCVTPASHVLLVTAVLSPYAGLSRFLWRWKSRDPAPLTAVLSPMQEEAVSCEGEISWPSPFNSCFASYAGTSRFLWRWNLVTQPL